MRSVLVCVWSICVLFAAARDARAQDVVAYASDVTTMRGTWTRVSDASAAGGSRMSSSDSGWSAADTPLANPPDYFEVPIAAAGNTTYRVWVRLRAGSNSKWNDSVWLQFGDALSTGGAAIYRTGTTSGLLLNLEACSGCGLNGWGWVGGAYWLTQTALVRFASTGTHTIRVQTREDGAQVDQIVLSPATWLQSAPGQPSGDSTIVPKPSSPFSGAAIALPGTIQAEDFDQGGEGVAYHDTTSGNAGGVYRSTDVDLQPASGGGYNVGWTKPGEWLQYSVNAGSAGSYMVSFRVASPGAGGTFHLEMNGVNVTGSVSIPATGDWQTYQTVSKTVALSAGAQKARLVLDSAAGDVGNFDWLRFTAVASPSTPYSGSPAAIPGTIEAEHFDNGGEGVAYHDTTAGNSGGVFRSTDVDLEPASGGGYDVGWMVPGEWLQYSVNVSSAATYTVQFRVASSGGGGAFHLEANGGNVTGTLSVPSTGGWQSWQTVTATAQLAAGPQTLRLVVDAAGWNIDRMQLSSGGGSGGGGSIISVGPGENLQAAINAAQPGDTILLTPSAVYEGGLTLPEKSGAGYITIRSAAPDSALPGPGVRITPQYVGQLPRIQGGTAGLPAIRTGLRAHHWRLQFLELVDTWQYGDVLVLGDGSSAQNTLGSVAHDLIVDRVYIHALSGQQQKRGIALNSASTTVMNSYISGIRLTSGDSQAIAGWNGPGPYTITNNYLEASGENIMFGGGDPAIQGLIPSDIVLRGNTITKQTSWRGSGDVIKNLIELKNAQRVQIDGNVIEYCWMAGQFGHAIVLTPRNQDGTAPWSNVRDIQITNNVIRHVAGVLNVLGTDNINTSGWLTNITVRNNLVVDMSKANWGGAAQLILTSGGSNITIDHNTVFSDGNSMVYAGGAQVSGFVFTNNIIPDNLWAVMGAATAEGSATLAAFYPGAVFQRNVIIGGQSTLYPTNNYFPATVGQVGFVDPSGNFRLSTSSPYRNAATDGTDIGANIPAINTAAGTGY